MSPGDGDHLRHFMVGTATTQAVVHSHPELEEAIRDLAKAIREQGLPPMVVNLGGVDITPDQAQTIVDALKAMNG